MARPLTCACGADLTTAPNRVYIDDTNAAINRASKPQCMPCFAARYMKPSIGNEWLLSADAMAWIAVDQGRYPRSSYVVLATPTGSVLYR